MKPRPLYYAENLASAGMDGADVLMVGNNTVEDLSFMHLGADGYLVTDWLLDPVDFDLGSVKHGTMADFAAFAAALPPCAHPASSVQTGPIDPAEAEAVRAANDGGTLDGGDAAAHAAAATDDVLAAQAPGSREV